MSGDQVVRAEWDDYAEHTVHHGLSARFDGVGAVHGTPAVGAIGQSVSDRHYGYAGRSGQAGAIWSYGCAVQDDRNIGAGTAGAAEYNRYIEAAGNTIPIGQLN